MCDTDKRSEKWCRVPTMRFHSRIQRSGVVCHTKCKMRNADPTSGYMSWTSLSGAYAMHGCEPVCCG
jgi:hypothetical protein